LPGNCFLSVLISETYIGQPGLCRGHLIARVSKSSAFMILRHLRRAEGQ